MKGLPLALGGVGLLAAASERARGGRLSSPLLYGSITTLLYAFASSAGRSDAFGEAEDEDEDDQSWRGRVIRRVSQHEGGPDATNPNTDDAGLSYGIIQWTQISKNLGKLLVFLQRKDPDAFAKFFGPNWRGLIEHAQAGESKLSSSLSDGKASGRLWEEPWLSRFKAAGRYPPFQAAQWEYAENYDDHILAAEKISNLLGLATERALVLFYDRAVQQGPNGAPKVAEAVASSWGDEQPPYMEALNQYAQANADLFRASSPKSSKWRKVGEEYHRFADKVDLYRVISKRNQSILQDPNLSDEPIRIEKRMV